MSYMHDDYEMNYIKEEEKESFFKRNKGILIALLIAFLVGIVVIASFVGGMIVGSFRGVPKQEYNELQKQLESANSKIVELESQIKLVNPLFDMNKLETSDNENIQEENLNIEGAKTFKNGNFVAGRDFEPGIYDVVATQGGGIVTGGNMFNGGIMAIMGPADDGFYQKEYKNITLKDGDKLKVSNVTIQLIPVK